MKIAIAIATAVVLFASISGASAQNLPGKYNVEGKNLDGRLRNEERRLARWSVDLRRPRWRWRRSPHPDQVTRFRTPRRA
jgi:hypothetical protein